MFNLEKDEDTMAFLMKKRDTLKKAMKIKLQCSIAKDIDLDDDEEYTELQSNINQVEKQNLCLQER